MLFILLEYIICKFRYKYVEDCGIKKMSTLLTFLCLKCIPKGIHSLMWGRSRQAYIHPKIRISFEATIKRCHLKHKWNYMNKATTSMFVLNFLTAQNKNWQNESLSSFWKTWVRSEKNTCLRL
jgi:hypothetical protein